MQSAPRRLLAVSALLAAACLAGGGSAGAASGTDPCASAGGTPGHGVAVGALTCTFTTPGSAQFVVPAGVTSTTITALGAKGGDHGTQLGGKGAQASGTFTGLAGTTLTVVVGGQGGPASNTGTAGTPDGGAGGDNPSANADGAGGGGSSSVATTGGKIVIAGGGGGAGNSSPFQLGLAPGFGANAGVGQLATSGQGAAGAPGGAGGSQPLAATPNVGGLGGPGGMPLATCNPLQYGAAGNSGSGATGGAGAGSLFTGAGGGGGGGYAGGGGGGSGARCNTITAAGGGGGGGSSFVAAAATSPSILQNGNAPGAGDGSVTIAYQLPKPKNLITDGGFEQPAIATDGLEIDAPGTIGPWAVSGSVDLVKSTYWQAAEGTQSVDLAGSFPGAVTYTFTAPYADSYKVTFKLAGNPDCTPVKKQIGVYWNGALVTSPTFSTKLTSRQAMGWKSKSVTVAGLPGSVSLAFVAINTGPCGPVLDQVAVKYL